MSDRSGEGKTIGKQNADGPTTKPAQGWDMGPWDAALDKLREWDPAWAEA